jgi:hypothetical protein
MSDLPTIQYTSSDEATIARQISWAANAGITGFISSWWGPGDKTDSNFAKLLASSATLESATGSRFASAIYIENNAPALQGTMNMIRALQYVIAQYVNDPHYFHWHGKPVIFFASPIVGNGRTLATWSFIRSQIDAYNSAHHTQKIWAAGVLPGYDDTRVPGRTGTYIVPRNNGATYRTSWMAAIASNPGWITITTFNEWFEGAMIEPSIHYGNLYLDLTAQYAKLWRG